MNLFAKMSLAMLPIGAAWWLLSAFPDGGRTAPIPRKGEVHHGDAGPVCPIRRIAGVKDSPLVRGKGLYLRHCASCHGEIGDGRGGAAQFTYPKPRDFTFGQFKIRSTASGMPTDEDLLGVITRGTPGSSMPGFDHLAERDRRDLVAYVKYLSAKVQDGRRVNHFEENPAGASLAMPARPAMTPELAAKGAKVFAALDCANCHGTAGKGDGPQSATMKDAWGGELKPRGFARDRFIGGESPEAIYQRIAAGIGGTPMNAYPDSMVSPGDRWALVAHVLALRESGKAPGVARMEEGANIKVGRCATALPTGPGDAAWSGMPAHAVMVNPIWRRRDPTRQVIVRAAHDGRRIAMLVEWASAKASDSAVLKVQDFSDAVAIQFSLTDRPGFIGMGDPFHPVNLWQWRATHPVGGAVSQMTGLYPQRKTDLYPDAGAQYQTAAMAGNTLAMELASPIQESNAYGFGTLVIQKPKQQGVSGGAMWKGGRLRAVFLRGLRGDNHRDVDLSPGRKVPVAFAVWDGRNGDRNGQKSVSSWHFLELEK